MSFLEFSQICGLISVASAGFALGCSKKRGQAIIATTVLVIFGGVAVLNIIIKT